jgi:hypothetical protein
MEKERSGWIVDVDVGVVVVYFGLKNYLNPRRAQAQLPLPLPLPHSSLQGVHAKGPLL